MLEYEEFILRNYKDLCEFVLCSTIHFDDTHDFRHALKVTNNALIIFEDEQLDNKYKKLVIYAAMLHDVCDHKYPDSIPFNELKYFISTHFDYKETNIICDIINSVSFSKEVKGERKVLQYPYDIILNIVSDADKLEALGYTGLERCENYGKIKGEDTIKHVLEHCYYKLLRLLPDGFIRTKKGRQMAEPLHDVIVEYVKKHQ